MAGMFYSLEEAADKLGMSHEEVKQLATDGKLREFRDGSNIMFKIDEVEALLTSDEAEPIEDLELALEPSAEADDIDELLDLEPVADENADSSMDDLLLEPVEEAEGDELASLEEDALTMEADDQDAAALDEDLDALLGFGDDEADTPAEVEATEDDSDDLSLLMEEDDSDDLSLVESELDMVSDDDDLGLDLSDTQVVSEEPVTSGGDDEEDIFLAAESTGLADGTNELTDMDTALSGEEGINLLGETDGDFKLTDDTMAETLAGLGATGETSLEEIEDDLSLDSFGSGSGLLDLSLQADDTSLGGILDEIYTNDSDDAGSPADEDLDASEDLMSESETLPMDEGMGAEETFVPAAMPMMTTASEIPADASSRMLGGMLFLPLFIVLYTAIIAISGMNGNVPVILSVIKPWIWYIMGGLVVIAIILSVVAMTKSDEPKPKKAKTAKAPKQKKVKAPKEKKPKKEKVAKPKKEKKPKKKK